MTISPETEAQILRYYHAERWRIGTIASQLGVHHGSVPGDAMRNAVHPSV